MRQECKVGMLVRSLAGHDKTNIYVIMKADDAYVYLADGKIRKMNRLKKKKRKHIEILDKMCDVTELMNDTQIRKIIKELKKEEV
ncbi:MAG: KOW domain-containing RNA-binding protein [Eubacteriales bacterium]|nr:KOW domain-containing RNA-binding protein [Eubacteriales bacterium]